MFIEPVVRTYQELGVNAQYRPVNDIQVDGRKIGGTGAASIGESTVMAGSFMYDFDTANMARCLKVPSEKFRDKLKSTLDDYMTTMVKQLDEVPNRGHLITLFLKHCAGALGVTPEMSEPTEAELKAIAEEEKALTDPDWTYKLGRKFVEMGVKISSGTHLTESAHKAPGGLIRVHLLESDGKIGDLMLSGDFTCLPPGAIDSLAERLVGETLDADALTKAAASGIDAVGAEIPGVEPADFATAIMAAKEAAG